MPSNHETLLRQWQMLRFVPRYPAKITATQLKEKLDVEDFNVTKRTVERDLQDLSLAFPLMMDDRSKPYGWSWQKNAPVFDLPGLGNNEALTLMLVEQHLIQLLPTSTLDILTPYFKAAHQHLTSLPKSKHVLAWANKVRTVPPTQPLLPPKIIPEIQRIVSEALLANRQLQIIYQPRGKKAAEYRIHPLALVQRVPLLYLQARIFDYEDTRTLAMHRIVKAEILDETTQYPPHFNIDDEIAKGRFGFEEQGTIHLVLRFEAQAAEHLRETPLSKDQSISNDVDDKVIVTASVPDTQQLHWWIMGFGEQVEVLEPEDLRQSMAETAVALYSVYIES